MRKTVQNTIYCVLILFLLAACSAGAERPANLASTVPASTPQAATDSPVGVPINVRLLYPSAENEVEMGQAIRLTAQVTDEQGNPVDVAVVTIDIADPNGQPVISLATRVDKMGVYRTENWLIPHRSLPGDWTLTVAASSAGANSSDRGTMRVKNSTSEELYSRYGFWIDEPTMRATTTFLSAERGDARNGMIRWGGAILAQHILPQNWVDINWREGEFPLDTAEDAKDFLMGEIDDLAFTQVRELGPFEKIQFKQWDAWKVGGIGGVSRDLVEWVLFYVPEVDKTYSIGTTVTSPPVGVDPHEELRKSFEVDPESVASGVAPEPLPDRLPAPELIAPPLGAKFVGTSQPIVLEWEPVKELAADEYYQVFIEYNYVESSPDRYYATRDTTFALPEELYRSPNCFIFNWQIKLMRQTGIDPSGQPVGEEISNPSLYRYLRWNYPPESPRPFEKGCPNDQY